MNKIVLFFILLLAILPTQLLAQNTTINGTVICQNAPVPYVAVTLNSSLGSITDENGKFSILNVPEGQYQLSVKALGFASFFQNIEVTKNADPINFDIELQPQFQQLNEVVISGTRTAKRLTDSPVMVNIVNAQTLQATQSCNVAEGLRFQPGLRVETDCQTCNYTQLRMNGLAGSYSQILINGRPIFSPLLGLYGLEQFPANMLERIEVVRGGGSALYGSSAIGGTVNIITKIPKENNFEINNNNQLINGEANENILLANGSILSKNKKLGLGINLNRRTRSLYDHNNDGFSELPKIQNLSGGLNLFFLPTENQKLEVSLSHLNEYRYGGEITNIPPHLAQQSEERLHKVWMASADYQINFNQNKSSFIGYAATQITNRTHYTGIFPDSANDIFAHLKNPPYGTSANTTMQAGAQLNHKLNTFWGSQTTVTIGTEFLYDDVLDQIEAYDFKIDQTAKNLGTFLQTDWQITPKTNLLAGVRVDAHNFVNQPIVSPRLALMLKPFNNAQVRFNWGRGFRAPQAFDADMHIAFAGGGVSRISLAPNLGPEFSNSFSTSVNYDKATRKFIAGFTLEGFYTTLNNAFYLYALGEDDLGERFEKRNGSQAKVYGSTLELRANYNSKVQWETGFTIQRSQYTEPVNYIDGLAPQQQFLRTPNRYGFSTLTLMPTQTLNISVNGVYTGSMLMAHFGGAPTQLYDAYKISQPFTELSFKVGYTFNVNFIKTNIECYGGIKNITNAYQSDFDTGKNRDSNYVYGPSLPRTFFLGVRIFSF